MKTTTPRFADFALSVKLRSFAVTLTDFSSAALCGAFATDGELAGLGGRAEHGDNCHGKRPDHDLLHDPSLGRRLNDRNPPGWAMPPRPTATRHLPVSLLRVPSPLCAVLLAVVALTLSACSSEESSAGSRFEPVHPGVLTVATAFLPARGFWEGDPPTWVASGPGSLTRSQSISGSTA